MEKKFAAKDDEVELVKSVVESPESSKKDLSWYQTYPSALVRGTVEGLERVGESISEAGAFGPLLRSLTGKRVPSEEQRQQVYEKYLPIGEDLGPRALERGTRASVESIPLGAMGGPLSTAIRAGVGGVGAEGLKEMGAPDWAQTGFEIGSQLVPGLGKKIPNRLPTSASRAEEQLANEARRLGLSEEELALTLNQRGPVTDFLQNISSKGGRTVKRFQRTREALGRVWGALRSSPEAQTTLTGQHSSDLINGISQRLSHLPAEQRARVSQDFQDFIGSSMKGEDVIDFWQKINYYIQNGETGLGTLKPYLQTALERISPSLGKDFQITNQLYGNFHKLAERMGPNIAESLIKAGENGIIVTAITTGNYPLLKKVLSPLLARQLATEMTTNPRLMNISSRLINSVEKGSPVVAKKIYDELVLEIGKTNAEAAMKMSGLDFDKLFDSLPDQKNQK